MPIRNSAKAIILRNRALLCTQNVGWRGDHYYLLPGGGQEHGETLVQALERECLEEIGARVRVGNLRFIREYIGKNHAFAERQSGVHQNEFMFVCELLDEPNHAIASGPDNGQTGLVWIDLDEINDYQIFPSGLKTAILPTGELTGPVYWGDTN